MKISRRANADRYYLFEAFGFALFLHRLHHDEDEGIYHSHPWSGISLIFGSYLEEKLGQQPKLKSFFNFVDAFTPHRISLPFGPVWTLFFHFRRKNTWMVYDSYGRVLDVEPWRGLDGRKTYKP